MNKGAVLSSNINGKELLIELVNSGWVRDQVGLFSYLKRRTKANVMASSLEGAETISFLLGEAQILTKVGIVDYTPTAPELLVMNT
eukprot:8224947-Ditylum_brightwellii.AAC.1